MMTAPKIPHVAWNYMGKQLKLWKRNKLSEGHSNKMLRLWIGYEFVDLIDQDGKIQRQYFNEVRHRLGYNCWVNLLKDIQRTNSFYIIGKKDKDVTSFFSPIWRRYEETDGQLLIGSIPLRQSQPESPVETDYVDNNNIDNPNGVNAAALSLLKGDWPDGNQKKMFSVKKEVVKEYFDWLLEQTEGNHQQLVNDIKYKIAHPLDKDGNPVKPRPKLHISIGPESA